MFKYLTSCFIIMISIISCKNSEELNAESIINKSIAETGTFHFAKAKVNFDFRNISYTSHGECGNFLFKREFTKDSAIIIDEFDQKTLKRKVNQQHVPVIDSLANLYAESINSVFYFVQLPYRLNDEATQKKLIGTDTIKGKEYHKIKVTFQEEGGGQDFEDIYVYWINSKTYQIDYLAYSFLVNGGGIRFREAYNPRKINSIQFVDYRNYQPKNKNVSLYDLGKHFENGELQLISTIEKSSIKVDLHDKDCF